MENRWSEVEAEGLTELESLVYQSRLIGADQSLVIWGGGNTSLKVTREDFRGRETKVMLIKGSGSDMKAAQSKDFPSVRMDDILPLFERPDITDEERDQIIKTMFHLGYIKSVPGKWVLTMKGQQILIIMNELKSKGHVEDIDSRWLHKNGAQKLGEFLFDAVRKK